VPQHWFWTLPQLKDPQRERFAFEVAAGKHPKQAFAEINLEHPDPAAAARRWKRIPEISARISEFRALQELDADDPDSVIAALVRIQRLAVEGEPILDKYGRATDARKRDLQTGLRAAQILAGRSGALERIDPNKFDFGSMTLEQGQDLIAEIAPRFGLRVVKALSFGPVTDLEPVEVEAHAGK
jgi:hypothetical protein